MGLSFLYLFGLQTRTLANRSFLVMNVLYLWQLVNLMWMHIAIQPIDHVFGKILRGSCRHLKVPTKGIFDPALLDALQGRQQLRAHRAWLTVPGHGIFKLLGPFGY